jgi:hypothetical protein
MKNLQEATERICELKGGLVALDALLPAVIDTLSAAGLSRLTASFDAHAEVARTLMLNSEMSDVVLAAFEREVARNSALLRRGHLRAASVTVPPSLDPLLLTTTRVTTLVGTTRLSENTGFFFLRGGRLFLVSTGQAFVGHHETAPPDRIRLQLPADPMGIAWHTVSLPMQLSDGRPRCRAAAEVDVAVMAVDPAELPPTAALMAFDESHLDPRGEIVGVGDPVATVSMPLGTAEHQLRAPLARSGAVASSFGLSYEGAACFLTELHAPASSAGSAVVRRRTVDRTGHGLEQWQLIGILSRDPAEGPDGPCSGLHRAWYADVLASLADAC